MRWFDFFSIKRWHNRARLKGAYKVFHKLYNNVDAHSIAKAERHKLKIDSFSMVYGEIEFYSFAKLLELAEPKPSDVFYDLGSGAGKAVFTAALLFNLNKIVGVELLSDLVALSQSLLNSYHSMVENSTKISFIHGDLLKQNLTSANIVFINATGFFGEQFAALEAKLLELKAGSRIIISSKQLSDQHFQHIHGKHTLMSWGHSYCRIYRKK